MSEEEDADGRAPGHDGFDRRQFLVASAIVTQLTLAGCNVPAWESVDEATGERLVEFTFRRAEDQIELRFRFLNARLSDRLFHNLALRKADKQRPLRVQIIFPPQYILEQSFLETQNGGDALTEPPVKSELSGESRLVFQIDDLVDDHLPLSSEGLLDWTKWTPCVVPPVVPVKALRAPGPLDSYVETPARIFLSLDRKDSWKSSTAPRRANGRTELWGARASGPEGARPKARAIWTRDETSAPPGFLTTLTAYERKALVELTHVAEFKPEPLEPDLLMLTSFGSWFDVDKTWPLNATNVTAYRHRGEEGRVDFEQIELEAVLFPFGFYVSLVVTTQRKDQLSPSSNPTGYLRTRLNIKFNEKSRQYAAWDFPLSGIDVHRDESPPLDWPTMLIGSNYDEGAFWVDVAGLPYAFPFEGIDHDKVAIPFTAPMICVVNPGKVLTPAAITQLGAIYDDATNFDRRTRGFGAAAVAVSPGDSVGKTAVSVDQIEFGSRPGQRSEAPRRGFEPVAQHIKAALTAASANKAVLPGMFAWFDPYDPEAPTNPNQVYLKATPGRQALTVDYSTHTGDSGGFLAPKYDVAGVAKGSGAYGGGHARAAVGDSFANGSFDPGDFFPADATFLGGIRMSWILQGLSGFVGDKVPSILSDVLDLTESEPQLRYSFSWQTDQLKNSPPFDPLEPIFQVKTAPNPTYLSVSGEGIMPLDDPAESYATFTARLDNFTLKLVYAKNGIGLDVNSVTFNTSTQEKGRFAVSIGDYWFEGEILEFVEELAAQLGLFGDDSPIDFSPSGVTIHLPSIDIPPIIVGALNIFNLSIRSGLRLPFNGDPLEFNFALSSPQDMFAVTISIYGGAGYFLIVLDTYGLKQVDASISFGAFGELNLAGGAIQGSAFVLGGFSYSSLRQDGDADHGPTTKLDYSAFVHAGGSASLLGLITIGIDFHLGLAFDETGTSSRLWGYCDVTYSVKVLFFSKSVSAHFEREFSRSGNRTPNLIGAYSADDEEQPPMSFARWQAYRAAFASAA